MIVTSNDISHELSIPNLNTIGLVGDNENVVYEAVLYINSSLKFDHTYTTKQFRYPEQTGTETQTIEEIEYGEGQSQIPPQATLVKEEGVVYFEYQKTEVGVVVEKEIEVPTYDIPSAIEEDIEVTEEKKFEEFSGFSVQFPTNNIDPFTIFDDLTEDVVLSWIPESVIQPYLDEHKEKLVTEQDKFLNPKKYKKDSPVAPWIVKADQLRQQEETEL